jgi:hypothetical protein
MIIPGKFPRLVRAVAAFAFAAVLLPASAQNKTPLPQEKTVKGHATGSFDVSLSPPKLEDGDTTISRIPFSKQFHGDMTGSSTGQMLAVGSPAQGMGGYVAMEKMNVTLAGRMGGFVLQHTGTMDHGRVEMSVKVVPDSGTGELAGISGTFNIRIEEGSKHFYDFDYTLPAK